MKLRLLLAILAILLATVVAREKEAYAVWDSSCIHIGQGTQAFAPLKDGQPDIKDVKLRKVILDTNCWHYEMR